MCIRDLDDCSNQSGCPRPLHMMRYGIAHLSSIWPATVTKVVRFNWRSSSGKIVFFCMFSWHGLLALERLLLRRKVLPTPTRTTVRPRRVLIVETVPR